MSEHKKGGLNLDDIRKAEQGDPIIQLKVAWR